MFTFKEHHRPLRGHVGLSVASIVLHFAAFLLLLLVGLSLPIIKTIYLLSFKSTVTQKVITSVATELRFGVWGVCATGVFNEPTLFSNNGECFGPRLGYTIPPILLPYLGLTASVAHILETSLEVLLVLHPVAAGLSFCALLCSLYLASEALSIIGLILSILTALLTGVVFGVDVAFVVIAKTNVNKYVSGLDVQLGNAIWMALVSLLCSWAGTIVLCVRCCYCCGIRKRDKY